MKTESSRVLTAEGIEKIIGEHFERTYNGGIVAPFVEDYYSVWAGEELSDWQRVAVGKRTDQRGREPKQKTEEHQEVQTAGTGSWGFPSPADANSDTAAAFDLCPLTNRAGTKPRNEKADTGSSAKLGGYDGGFEIGFEGGWQKEQFTALKEHLESVKQSCSETLQDVETVIGGKPALVKPSGARVGNSSYNYVFEVGGVTCFIHRNPKGGIQPVRVRYSAAPLIQYGLFALHNKVREFLLSIGFKVLTEKISRLDMQVMLERKVSDFIVLILNNHAVKRATTEKVISKRGKFQTYTLGCAGSAELCIYDKKEELWECCRKDTVKLALMLEHCITEEMLLSERPLTRIEFRLWRSTLRALKINSVQDLQDKERGLVDWLTSHWFRLLETEKVKGHEKTAEVHSLWLEVRSAFFKWFNGSDGECKPVEWENPKPVSCNPEQLEKQGIGCLAKAAALRFGKQDLSGALSKALTIIQRYGGRLLESLNVAVAETEIRRGVVLGIPAVPDWVT